MSTTAEMTPSTIVDHNHFNFWNLSISQRVEVWQTETYPHTIHIPIDALIKNVIITSAGVHTLASHVKHALALPHRRLEHINFSLYICSYRMIMCMTKLAKWIFHNVFSLYNVYTMHALTQLQQKLVEKFCLLYMFDVKYKLPRSWYQDPILSRHLLVDNHSNTLFCFAPKVGSTNLKLALLYAQSLLSKEDLDKAKDNIDQGRLKECIVMDSFLSRKKSECIEILKRCFKFIMYCHPLERLLSAYRSKTERYPLVGLQKDTPHYNWLRRCIYGHIHLTWYKNWLLHGGRPEVNISFSDFIDYWLTYDLSSDEHFRTIFSLCEPCCVQYNYYGNFEIFNKDANVLIKRIGGGDVMLRSG